ncbi:hypothetical protein KVR01_010070 [Diaporthe batatas]|uniref:uncharacterized protein n=1 Tax=Diaporthe batatas TaxID=748121 RepID=UPI001D052F37|nr:uncharacterized protein KVR01_010070 [Diaporthe batatas]KAG8160534.1 hypothetical protein KVR01_010070 [Diaporthe batatas]
MPAGHSNSIFESNRRAARDGEALLWGALCDDPSTAAEYIEKDCVVMNPLLHPDKSFEALTEESEPTLAEALEKLAVSKHRWTSYVMHRHDPTPATANVEMFAVQIMYRMTLIRETTHRHHHHHHNNHDDDKVDEEKKSKPDMQKVDAFCTSTWRQGSNGGWKLCSQQLIPIS